MAVNISDAFIDDWYGYMTNQAGHFVLGLFLSYAVPWWMVLVGYLGWEIAAGWNGWDSAEDIVFVMLGVAFFRGLRKYAMISAMLMMSVGVFRRANK